MTREGGPVKAKRRRLLAIAFVEGGALMVTELAAARLVAPFYGNSLHVWAAVLGMTLAGLAGGYFLGGWLAGRPGGESRLHGFLVLAAAFLLALPWTAPAILGASLVLPLRSGILLAVAAILVPPLVCLGTAGPLITGLLGGAPGASSGRAAGRVYSISTLGGILFTAGAAFHAIPEWGVRETLIGTAALLAFLPLEHRLRQWRRRFVGAETPRRPGGMPTRR